MATPAVWLELHPHGWQIPMLINMQHVERLCPAVTSDESGTTLYFRGGTEEYLTVCEPYGEVVARLRTALAGQFGKDYHDEPPGI